VCINKGEKGEGGLGCIGEAMGVGSDKIARKITENLTTTMKERGEQRMGKEKEVGSVT